MGGAGEGQITRLVGGWSRGGPSRAGDLACGKRRETLRTRMSGERWRGNLCRKSVGLIIQMVVGPASVLLLLGGSIVPMDGLDVLIKVN
jgi:hypothetical protein